jgi:hypothetical protein
MKKTFSMMLLASLILVSAFTTKKSTKPSASSAKIFSGSQSVLSANGNSVTVDYSWNTNLPLGSRVHNVSVIDNYGYSIFTVTYFDQYPYMNLVGGTLVTNGWRCNFTTQNGGADHVILGGVSKP